MSIARSGRAVRPPPSATSGAASRRLDWRFLLPASHRPPLRRLRLLSDDPASAVLITESQVATDVLLGVSDKEAVDAVVSLDGTPVEVAAALHTLRAGGVLYCEVDRSRRSWWRASPARFRRQLQAAGVTTTTVYWRTRRGGHDTLFLPLDVPGAAPWYFRDLTGAQGVWRRLARRVLSTWVGHDGRRLAPLALRYSVLGVMASAHAGELSEPALGPAVLGDGSPERRLPVVLARGEGAWSRVVLLPFGDADQTPQEVVKLPRAAAHNAATDHEQRVLGTLRAVLPAELARAVPVPVLARTWQGLSVGHESFLPGRPLALIEGQRLASEGASLTGAVDWLIGFHRATSLVHEPSGLLGLVQDVDSLLRVLGMGLDAARTQQLGGAEGGPQVHVPTVWQHGDLTPTNLRWDGQAYTVVDWESARLGPAVVDLLYLLLHWRWDGLAPLGAEPERVFGALYLTADGEPAATARAQVRRYCAALDVDPHSVPLLLLTMLCQQAADRAERVKDSGSDPSQDDNIYVRLVRLVLTAPHPAPVWCAP